ncbi:MAG: 2Fe-2S iron-sulfur cluster-binding protein [Halolamina sp.]
MADDARSSDGFGNEDDDAVPVTVVAADGDEEHTLSVEPGTTLRDALLSAGLSPHATVARRANCGGRGLCATCGVRVAADPEPDHWHDDLARRFGYPRLSCQLTVEAPMRVRIPEKLLWGGRE